jgi:hypothetical protein
MRRGKTRALERMKKAALVLLYLASIVVAAVVGSHFTAKRDIAQFSVELEATQAMLNFNHRRSYGELEAYLLKGCNAEALEKARIYKAVETMQLATFFKDHSDTWATKYVSDREPALIAELANYRNPFGTSWHEPKCAK